MVSSVGLPLSVIGYPFEDERRSGVLDRIKFWGRTHHQSY
jgi:hypothetical protein